MFKNQRCFHACMFKMQGRFTYKTPIVMTDPLKTIDFNLLHMR